MIKRKGVVEVRNGNVETEELSNMVDKLPDGIYEFLLFDQHKNRSLPQLKYLFGVVLKTISDNLPEHPSVEALYRYFEERYAPIHKCMIQGNVFSFLDLKNESSTEVDSVIDKIIRYAEAQWDITIPSKDDLKAPEAKELYADAYTEMWKRYFESKQ